MYTNTISSNICRHENGVLNENQISYNNSDLEPGDYDGRPLSIVTHAVKYTLQNFLIVVVMATEWLQKRPQASLHTHRPLRFFQLKASSYEKREFPNEKVSVQFKVEISRHQVFLYIHQYQRWTILEWCLNFIQSCIFLSVIYYVFYTLLSRNNNYSTGMSCLT